MLFGKSIPVSGHAATASVITPVIAFLGSDRACWIDGANITADGDLEVAVNVSVLGF
jgi:hypothetical protein